MQSNPYVYGTQQKEQSQRMIWMLIKMISTKQKHIRRCNCNKSKLRKNREREREREMLSKLLGLFEIAFKYENQFTSTNNSI